MAVYMIGYDLNKKGKDYNGMYEAIKSYGSWWHHLDSTWLIDTQEDASQIFNKLKAHIDSDDRLLIIRVTNDYQGWLTEDAWKWIRERKY